MRFAAQQQCGIWFTYCQKGATDKTHRRLVQGTCPGTSALAENPWEMWVEFMGKLPSMVSRSLCSEASKTTKHMNTPGGSAGCLSRVASAKPYREINRSLPLCHIHPSPIHPLPREDMHYFRLPSPSTTKVGWQLKVTGTDVFNI